MNKESVGKLFKGNFGIYECVAYSDRPSVVMKNTITDESICVSIDSNYAKTFELIEEDKKIEKLDTKDLFACDDYQNIRLNFGLTWSKINEIIDYINGGTNGE